MGTYVRFPSARNARMQIAMAVAAPKREQLLALVESGATLAEMAAQLGRSKTSVRYWLKKYGMKTKNSIGRRPNVRGATGPTAFWECRVHGRTEFVRRNRSEYRCKRCRVEAVQRRRRRVKRILVEEAGGKCAICGYDRHPAALHFHHLDPAQKSFGLSRRGVTRSIDVLRAEARKCVLLCSNCHAEVEVGFASLPPRYSSGDVSAAQV
jgi:DNA-binding CsgD family transcriptional regulator